MKEGRAGKVLSTVNGTAPLRVYRNRPYEGKTTMRHFAFQALLLALLLLPIHALAAVEGFARVSLIQGDVQLRVADTDDWVPAAVNTPLYEGDSVWCPAESRVEIQLQDGSHVRLDAGSSLDILEVDDDSLQFHLGMGHAYVRTGAMRKWSMQFDMTESTVKVYDQARFRLDIAADGDEEISVFKGVAYVESYGSRTRVRTGEMLSVEDDRAGIAPLNPPDNWEKWNEARDRKAAGRRASGRLPEELVVYEEELDSAGEWVDVAEYGSVWRPTLAVSVDWAPYRVGRWIWRGGDYVWISYEPWGWVPYHYGRWVVIAGRGWCWVPPVRGDVYWGPGYVGWITTPTYVGWVPLAPGEIFYGRRHYGRASVQVTNITNITSVNISQTNVVYRNARVHRDALTVVQRDAFVRGRYSHVRARESIFRDRAVAGRPEPRQDAREVRMPRVRSIPASKLPPPAVTRVPARELRERHPRVFTEEERRGRAPQGGGRREMETRPQPPPAVIRPQPVQPERRERRDEQKVIIDRGRGRAPVPDAGRREMEMRPQPARPAVQPQPAEPVRQGREPQRQEQREPQKVIVDRPERGRERAPAVDAGSGEMRHREQPAVERPARKVWKIRPREEVRPEKGKPAPEEKRERRRD